MIFNYSETKILHRSKEQSPRSKHENPVNIDALMQEESKQEASSAEFVK